jgi:hypothetical protein
LILTGKTVYDTGGNNNGKLDPGETADMTTTFFNIGGADVTNMSTILACSCPFVTINDNSGYFGTLAIDSTRENTSDPYNVTIDNETPHGTAADFTVYVSGNGGFADTFAFTLTLGVPVPTDTGYYYVYYSGGPHPQSPVFNWVAIDSTQTTYPGSSLDLGDNETVLLSLPFTFRYYGVDYTQVSVCSNGWIAMGNKTDVDWTNSAIPNADGPSAMIAGLWDDLDPGNAGAPSDIYSYYDAATHRFIVEYFRVEHYASGYEETFEIIFCDPNYYSTPTGDGEIYVQYLVEQQQSDNTLGIENAAENLGIQYFFNDTYHPNAVPVTDHFALRYTTIPPEQTGVKEYSTPLARTMLAVCPSVTRGYTTISYSMPANLQRACIMVYDMAGRQVRAFEIHPGDGVVMWDGTDHRGHSVPSGVYVIHLDAGEWTSAAKVIIIE